MIDARKLSRRRGWKHRCAGKGDARDPHAAHLATVIYVHDMFL
jgi:hypothetical protein